MIHRWQRYVRFTAVLLLPLLFLLSIQTTSAQTKSFYWERFDVEMTLLENGDMRVVESQTINFSGAPFTFGFGTIPTGEFGANDGIVDVSVREGDQIYTEVAGGRAPNTFTVDNAGNDVIIEWYFEPALGSRTYTFSYTVKGGVRVGSGGEDGDQIFWKAIPSDRGARVEQSTVTIRLPEGVAPQRYFDSGNYLVTAYINEEETDAIDIRTSDDGRIIFYTLNQPLPAYDLLEVRVQFPHEALDITTPEWQQRMQRGDVISLTLLVISLLALVGGPLLVLSLWYVRGRDPKDGIVVPDYITEPPDNLSPALVGTLIDEKADMSDIISTLVYLAHHGYLTIEEERNNHIFHRTDQDEAHLGKFEQEFMRYIFGNKQKRSLKDLRYKFHNKIPRLRKQLYQDLVDKKLMPRSPQSVRLSYGLLAGALLFGAFVTFVILSITVGALASTLVCLPMAIGFTAVVLLITARFIPSKTRAGAEATAHWNAFKKYLQDIEDFENLEEAKEIFEKYLPYATAFGMERRWIRKFAAVPATPVPPWYQPYGPRPIYHGGGAPRPGGGMIGGGTTPSLDNMAGGLGGGLNSMSSSLSRMLNSTATTMKATPPSSSSSGGGFSGGSSGGFSGGGFSGGGGSRGFG